MESSVSSQCYPAETVSYERLNKPCFTKYFGSSFLVHMLLIFSFMVMEKHMNMPLSYTVPMDIEIHDMEIKKSEPLPVKKAQSIPAPPKTQVARFVPRQPVTPQIETKQPSVSTPQVVQPVSAGENAAPVYVPVAPVTTHVSGPAVPGYGGSVGNTGPGGGSGNGSSSGKILDLGFGSGNGPSFITRAPMQYPLAARRMGREGKVLLRLTLDERGRLLKVEVLENPGYGFADAAIGAIKKSRFSPGRINDKPVASRARLPIRFTLQEG